MGSIFRLVNDRLIVNQAKLDFEQSKSETISIRCGDSGYPRRFLEKNIIVYVRDVNEAPNNLMLTSGTVPENIAGYVIGKIIVSDPDLTYQNHSLELLNKDAPFIIVGKVLKSSRKLNFEKQSSYNIRVRVKDNGGMKFLVY